MRKLTLPMVPVTIRIEQDDGSIKIEPRTPGWLLAQILASPNLTFAGCQAPTYTRQAGERQDDDTPGRGSMDRTDRRY